jgi:uncharacterized protein
MNKRIIALLAVVLIFALSIISVSAENQLPLLIDEADLLTESEEASIAEKLANIKKEYDLDIVFLTVNSIGDKTPKEYADDYYDNNGYGEDGALLLIAVDENKRYVSTRGSCIDKIDNVELGSEISAYLDNKNYVSAVNGFVDYVDKAYSFNLVFNLAISVGIGFIVAYIIASSMKGKLKSVRMQTGAANYVKANSMNVTASRDIFLYRTVSSRERKSDDDKTHTSSSGRTHGGGSL